MTAALGAVLALFFAGRALLIEPPKLAHSAGKTNSRNAATLPKGEVWVNRGFASTTVIGRSVKGKPIELMRLGKGSKRVLFIAQTHGDEYGGKAIDQFVDYLNKNRSAIPPDTAVDVIPNINPDGFAAEKRGNANKVDLNRNLPSEWSVYVSPTDDSGLAGNNAGKRAGSEPETQALMKALENRYVRVISLHSYGGIFDYDGPGSKELAIAMAHATGPAYLADANSSPAKGTSSGSLGHFVPEKYGIPVITVELNYDTIDDVLAGLLLAIRY